MHFPAIRITSNIQERRKTLSEFLFIHYKYSIECVCVIRQVYWILFLVCIVRQVIIRQRNLNHIPFLKFIWFSDFISWRTHLLERFLANFCIVIAIWTIVIYYKGKAGFSSIQISSAYFLDSKSVIKLLRDANCERTCQGWQWVYEDNNVSTTRALIKNVMIIQIYIFTVFSNSKWQGEDIFRERWTN